MNFKNKKKEYNSNNVIKLLYFSHFMLLSSPKQNYLYSQLK